jgi:hypothetical protein
MGDTSDLNLTLQKFALEVLYSNISPVYTSKKYHHLLVYVAYKDYSKMIKVMISLRNANIFSKS